MGRTRKTGEVRGNGDGETTGEVARMTGEEGRGGKRDGACWADRHRIAAGRVREWHRALLL